MQVFIYHKNVCCIVFNVFYLRKIKTGRDFIVEVTIYCIYKMTTTVSTVGMNVFTQSS